jgi:hypothetical protein
MQRHPSNHYKGPYSRKIPFDKGKMIFVSFNTRGVRGAPKKLTLKIILLGLKPNIILIQETMGSGEKDRETFSPCLNNWSLRKIDVSSLSGGLLIGWSPNFQALSSSVIHSTISIKLQHKNNILTFSVVNIYGPYSDRTYF